MGRFLFTKLLNLLCLLIYQYYFSEDRFLVSPTITWVRSLCGPYRWSLHRQFRVSAGCAPLAVRLGSRLLDQSRRQILLGKFQFTVLQLILGSYVLKRCWKWPASACRHMVTRNKHVVHFESKFCWWTENNALCGLTFISAKMITVHFYFQAKTARVQIWQTQTPQSATVTKETRKQFN